MKVRLLSILTVMILLVGLVFVVNSASAQETPEPTEEATTEATAEATEETDATPEATEEPGATEEATAAATTQPTTQATAAATATTAPTAAPAATATPVRPSTLPITNEGSGMPINTLLAAAVLLLGTGALVLALRRRTAR